MIPFLWHLPERPVIVEIGVHWGSSTAMMLASCRNPPIWWGFEPDPRNLAVLREVGLDVWPIAISDVVGRKRLFLSHGSDTLGREHTASSSLREPTKHLETHPWCTFDHSVEVDCMPLDVALAEVPHVDLIWCDVQGAQREVIAGAQKILARTTWLYIEVHPEPQYDGEPTFAELCALLPGFRVVERYDADVLFERVAA